MAEEQVGKRQIGILPLWIAGQADGGIEQGGNV